ncbi:bifunctional diguanylate cyclase/phosphodiesterase [Yoonia sediminilitoris]|nr:EAL domain-containing protein [Yoonia sediminilitoris]
MIIAALLVFATAFLNKIVRQTQEDHTISIVQTFADEFAARLEEKLLTRVAMVDLLRRGWEDGRIDTASDFGEGAAAIQSQFPDIQAINWVNSDGVIIQVNPLEGNEAALGLNLRDLDEPASTLESSTRMNSFRLTRPIMLAQGGRGLAGYAPVFRNGNLLGHINLVFRTDLLIRLVMGSAIEASYAITLVDDGGVVYGNTEQSSGTKYASERSVEAGGRSWIITVTPRDALIDEARSFIDEALLATGLILALVIAVTINEWERNKRKLKEREDRFALAIEGTSDGLYDINVETLDTYLSPRWYQMLGYKPDEMPASYETFRTLLHPQDAATLPLIPEIIQTDRELLEGEFRMRHKNGTWVDILSRSRLVREGGRPTRIVGTHVDLTELRAEQRKLRRAAVTDDLTGLRNRRELEELLQEEQEISTSNERICLMRIDLDRFKSINDRDGHDAGDIVLCAVADRLRESTFGFQTIARMGGDEFLVGWRTRAHDDHIVQVARSLVAAIEAPVIYANKDLRVGASVGIAFIEGTGRASVGEAIVNADIALKAAKKTGRGRHAFFQQSMRDAALKDAALALDIRDGLERGEFEPYFQPQIDIKSNRIVGFEALLRWNHQELGVLSAAQFVPAAENAHLIEEIDDRMFREICLATKAIDELGLPHATVSINISTARLMNSELVDRLLWEVDRITVNPARICIELLESTLLNERMETAVNNIYGLARAGFRIELDDFGTGHAAISSLCNFPVSRIKIDRTFVAGIHSDPSLPAITETLIDLGNNLGITVLVEGVESEAERAFFEKTKCDEIQGFLVGRPMPLNQIPAWVRKWIAAHPPVGFTQIRA